MKCPVVRSPFFICGVLALCLLLTACGGTIGGSASSSATSHASVSTVAPTPTLPPTPTPTPNPSANFKLFSGDGYTVNYPDGWSVTKSAMAAALARDSNTTMLIETVQSTTAVSPQGSVQGALAGMKAASNNYQQKNVPATVTINGIQWNQGAATASDPKTGANSTIYVLAATFPGNPDKLVAIIYSALTSQFSSVNTDDFQPMVQSFKFS